MMQRAVRTEVFSLSHTHTTIDLLLHHLLLLFVISFFFKKNLLLSHMTFALHSRKVCAAAFVVKFVWMDEIKSLCFEREVVSVLKKQKKKKKKKRKILDTSVRFRLTWTHSHTSGLHSDVVTSSKRLVLKSMRGKRRLLKWYADEVGEGCGLRWLLGCVKSKLSRGKKKSKQKKKTNKQTNKTSKNKTQRARKEMLAEQLQKTITTTTTTIDDENNVIIIIIIIMIISNNNKFL